MSQQSLEDLLVDEDELTEELLTRTLSPYAGIGNESGAFVPTERFNSLESKSQTTVVLLIRKAAYELDLAEDEGASPKEIAELSGINHNTVKTAVRELADMNLVVNNDGRYSIPTYNYESARDLIQEADDER
jgi:predicted transcriptional regulator